MNYIKVADDVRLSYKLSANAIYVSSAGDVVITTNRIEEGTKIPNITYTWLECICSQYYMNNFGNPVSIHGVFVFNRMLGNDDKEEFYAALRENLRNHKITIIENGIC